MMGLVLVGCASTQRSVLESEESQVQMRSIQTRAFDTTDLNKMMRTCIATLQDLGFVIDAADDEIGTITATKLDGYQLRMTVSVRARGERQLLVRANAQYQVQLVKDPKPYQDFFSALEKAIFLTAQQVD
jgi:hypothetical protein